ncbi:hypothetical protein ABFS82_03G043800 [Erythranthe guttata]|uniref:Thioredoxin domain-containing protein n=1 Tax=Erythranthe guttata TaxID=4155 RepID=A0A022QCT4_ERYGU|nr:PREDICTED: thioredoxin-like 4, chloroplastic [Erythranthe guttata]EYU25424.1 hypothetical protein MIMGU_mgv1a013495mg [Erythranthe guttata]|eukprot:XP_012851745.1 PREDICTED: thioredoxin-like 4, chloroplastic [Erythranthe guttata]
MQKSGMLHHKSLFNLVKKINGRVDFGNPKVFGNMFLDRSALNAVQFQKGRNVVTVKETRRRKLPVIKSMLFENGEKLTDDDDEDDDDELCPVDCVREFQTDEEFAGIMEKANEVNALVIVDFYRTSCGSCKYIEQGFAKLCKGSGNQEAPVVFLKHNVLDEYDEQSEVAERLRIKTVPLFHFYKNGVLLEAFATRDKERILASILKYTASASQEVNSIS